MSLFDEPSLQDLDEGNTALLFQLRSEATAVSCRALVSATMRIISENIADEELLYFFQLALFEACSNAACHAYPNGNPGELDILLRVTAGESIEAQIRDWGTGFAATPDEIHLPSPDAEKGRGLFIISKSCDEFEIAREDVGTRVRILKKMRKDQWIPYE